MGAFRKEGAHRLVWSGFRAHTPETEVKIHVLDDYRICTRRYTERQRARSSDG